MSIDGRQLRSLAHEPLPFIRARPAHRTQCIGLRRQQPQQPLMALVILWGAGRLALAAAGSVPLWLIAIVELSFHPALAALLAPPLIRAYNRNTRMLAVLAALWLIDVAFVVALSKADAQLALRALRLDIDLVLVLVTIIGGRIVPAFTANALRQRGETVGVMSRPWLEPIVIGVMVVIVIVDALSPDSSAAGWLAVAAAGAHALRFSGWRGLRTAGQPIVWALHIAYAWLPIGSALKAIWLLWGVPWTMHWVHAFTMGVFGTMILAVMTRASLGHTGRPLVVSGATASAYLLLTAAVAIRVTAPAIEALAYRSTVYAAGVLWTLAFALYLFVYTPILRAPRIDGKPG